MHLTASASAMAFAVVVLFVPALTGVLAYAENRRQGQQALQRALLGGRLALGLARAFANSVWTLWLTVLVLPLGRLLNFDCSDSSGCSGRSACPGSSTVSPGSVSQGSASLGSASLDSDSMPPVILVHGLYHNPAAWLVMRSRLRRAGFRNVRCYAYASFGKSFAAIADGLARLLLQAGGEAADGRVLLLGHSLGGLVIRAACADGRLDGSGCRVAGVVTLGTPHRGSTLAGILGLGRLARGLAPEGEVIRHVRALPACGWPGLSLFTPTDGMVLPLSGAFLDADELAAGWEERALPAMSHVGMLYSGAAARTALAFLRERAEAGRLD